ncbi:hypothetical protein K461DRAFT_67882 [Myriangium duriaei CBS 260.36]|uniref:Rhodopsin domain-containing protein n=1 Tax=Myriangium duriaei CBS 260.36 TaxID=1168546 RepID=A0A9P4MCC2_9PEZI|nr:hypothetical protein K461DRAFT_67882 [Myriangium duriaei CBS 260.36]
MTWSINTHTELTKPFIVILIVFTIMDFLCLLIRGYSRHINGKRFKELTDYVLVLAFLMILSLVVVIYGSYSFSYRSSEGAIIKFKLLLVAHILWAAATTTTRISLLLLYVDLFSTVKPFRYLSICMIIINFMNFLVQLFGYMFICTPYLSFPVGTGRCGDVVAFDTYCAIISVILDASVTIAPLPLLWDLRMSRSKKLGITFIVSIGFFVCILTILRLILSKIFIDERSLKQWLIKLFVSGLEPVIGFWITCFPFFSGVFRHIRGSKGYLALVNRLSCYKSFLCKSRASTRTSGIDQVDEMELALRIDSPSMRFERVQSLSINDEVSTQAEGIVENTNTGIK